MDVAIGAIIPDALCAHIHRVAVRGLLVVGVGVGVVIAAAADIAANEAHPEVGFGAADAAFVERGLNFGGAAAAAGPGALAKAGFVLGVAADGAAGATPFLEAVAVEDVLAEDGEETGGFVHALKADGAGGEFDEGRGGWGVGFGGAGGGGEGWRCGCRRQCRCRCWR